MQVAQNEILNRYWVLTFRLSRNTILLALVLFYRICKSLPLLCEVKSCIGHDQPSAISHAGKGRPRTLVLLPHIQHNLIRVIDLQAWRLAQLKLAVYVAHNNTSVVLLHDDGVAVPIVHGPIQTQATAAANPTWRRPPRKLALEEIAADGGTGHLLLRGG